MGPYWLSEHPHVGVLDLLMNKAGANPSTSANCSTPNKVDNSSSKSNFIAIKEGHRAANNDSPTTTANTAATTEAELVVVVDSPTQNGLDGATIDLRQSFIMSERELVSHETRVVTASSTLAEDHRNGIHFSEDETEVINLSSPSGVSKPLARKLDKYGFILNIDSRGNVCEDDNVDPSQLADRVPTFAESRITQRREKKWNATLQAWDRKRPKVFRRRLRKGIPDSLRGKVWITLGGGVKQHGLYQEIIQKTAMASACAADLQNADQNRMDSSDVEGSPSSGAQITSKIAPSAPTETPTKSLFSRPSRSSSKQGNALPVEPSEDYAETKAFRAIQDTIERDIHRTYPRHTLFYEDDQHLSGGFDDTPTHGLCDPELASFIPHMMPPPSQRGMLASIPGGQSALRRVLRAYSYYDREVGYCQGMNFIAGMFLTLMSEEEAFWLLVNVMQEEPCKMRGLFGEGMRETHMVLHVAERLTQQFLPRLFKHFEKEHIHVTMYATQWLLTQYTSSFRFDLVTRIWDSFLGEGWKIIYRVMLALLSQWQTQLLKMTFEEILAFFRELPDRVEGAAVMDTALKIPLRSKHILKYENEWQKQQRQQ